MESSGKTYALITGAANGIGFEFAKLLSMDSYNLVLIDIDSEKLFEMKNQLKNNYKNEIIILSIDLSKIEAGYIIFNKMLELNIEIDVLINNAGFGMFGFFANTSWDREQNMIQLHVVTPTQLIKLFLPGMLKRNHGKILNVASLAAFQPGPLMSIYYSTKAYLLSFSLSVANELTGTGVCLTVLCPGPTKTGFQVTAGNENPKIKWNMACSEEVARYGYRAMQSGKIIAIPGIINKSIVVIQHFLPRKFVCQMVRLLQERNRRKIRLQIDYQN